MCLLRTYFSYYFIEMFIQFLKLQVHPGFMWLPWLLIILFTEGLGQYRGQLMVELLKPKGASLGLTLREPTTAGGALIISKLKEAGIADRCGALHVGDRLLSVNKQSLKGKSITDVYRMLRRCDLTVELEIIPAHNFTHTTTSDSTSHRPTESKGRHFSNLINISILSNTFHSHENF